MSGTVTRTRAAAVSGGHRVGDIRAGAVAYTFTVGPGDYSGTRPSWRVECGEHAVTARTSVVGAMARTLVAHGAADGPWRLVDGASGAVRMSGPSLHGAARMTVSERDGGGIRFDVYRPRPAGDLSADGP